MTEDEVNIVCKKWLINNGYNYKGVLNVKPQLNANINGYGQVPVPDGNNQVLIDHQGINDREKSIIWIEAKGENDPFSELLQGFIRVTYACYHGGGRGLLAVPENEFDKLLEQSQFLTSVCKSTGLPMGLFNATESKAIWFEL